MALSYKEVTEILKMVDASDCQEVVVEVEETRLVVRKGGDSSFVPTTLDTRPGPEETPSAAGDPGPARPVAKSNLNDADGGYYVNAPMVGTFYRRASPDEAPFVNVGTKIAAGDALCLIEVMKLYTTIEATCAGEVTAVLAEDAALVEFDQPLFVIRPD